MDYIVVKSESTYVINNFFLINPWKFLYNTIINL